MCFSSVLARHIIKRSTSFFSADELFMHIVPHEYAQSLIHLFKKINCRPELVTIFGLSKWQGHELWVSAVPLLVSNASKHIVLTLGPSLAKG